VRRLTYGFLLQIGIGIYRPRALKRAGAIVRVAGGLPEVRPLLSRLYFVSAIFRELAHY
jgi:hypothetical protein